MLKNSSQSPIAKGFLVLIFASLLFGCSTQADVTSNDILGELHSKSVTCSIDEYDLEEVNSLSIRATIFDEPYSYSPIGLRQIEDLEIEVYSQVHEEFVLSTIHGFTYFDFTGGGINSPVIFANATRIYENPDDNSREDVVIAVIDGEIYHVWINMREAFPKIVAPFTFWDGDYNNFEGTSALMVVVSDLAAFNHIFLLTFEGNYLEIYWMKLN